MKNENQILVLLLLLFIGTVAHAEFQTPPPEMREKIREVETACRKELNGAKGPNAFMKLMQLKEEEPNALSKKCLAAMEKLPAPPGR